MSSDGYAVTAEGIDIADLDDGGDWLVEQGLGRVRIRATSRTDAVFVGIAREADVDRYLAGTSHDELREVRVGVDRYVSRDGGAPPSAPGEAGIWVASAAGEGTQTVEWDARDGRWTVVVMNDNGAAPVAADVSVGAKLAALPWISGGLLLAGLLVMAVGAGLIGVAMRGQATTTPTAVADSSGDVTLARSFASIREQRGQIGDRVDRRGRLDAALPQGLVAVLARADEDPGEAGGERASHVGLHVVTDHRRPLRRHVERGEHRLEERGRGLADHDGLPSSRVLERGDERPHVQRQPVGLQPVAVLLEGDQLGALHQEAERAVQRFVGPGGG